MQSVFFPVAITLSSCAVVLSSETSPPLTAPVLVGVVCFVPALSLGARVSTHLGCLLVLLTSLGALWNAVILPPAELSFASEYQRDATPGFGIIGAVVGS